MTETHVGEETHVYRKIGVAAVRADAPIEVGDWIHVHGAHDDLWFRVREIELDRKPVDHAERGQVVGIRIPENVHEGSEVLLADDETTH